MCNGVLSFLLQKQQSDDAIHGFQMKYTNLTLQVSVQGEKIYFHHSKLVFLSSSLLCSFQEGRVSLKKSKYHLVIYHTLLQSTSQLNLLYFYQAECMRGKVTGLVSWWYNVFCPNFTKDIHQFVIEWFLLN